MSSNEEETVGVWAWTPDYDLIIVEDANMEIAYGCQNRHTSVIEMTDSIFANAVGNMIDLQYTYDAVNDRIDENGAIMYDETMPVSFKEKEKIH